MLDFASLWDVLGELKTSLLFVIALPIFLATALASLADWAERHLAAHDPTTSKPLADNRSASARQPHSRRVTPTGSPIFQAGDGHSVKRS
jgi:hypothetical protein